MSGDPESLVLEYLEDIKAGRHEAAYAAFAEDATWTTPPSLPWPGKFYGRRDIFDACIARADTTTIVYHSSPAPFSFTTNTVPTTTLEALAAHA